jgi:hypothetical protein
MEDYDDGLGQAHQQDLLRQQEIEEDLGLFSPVYVLSSQQLTLEIQYFKSMEAYLNGLDHSSRRRVIPNSPQERQLANSVHNSRHQA